jgi:hypothetical protein
VGRNSVPFFRGVRRYYALRTSHDVVGAYVWLQLQRLQKHILRETVGASSGLLGCNTELGEFDSSEMRFGPAVRP